MKRQALFVELWSLHGPSRPLDSEPDEIGSYDVPVAHRTGAPVDVPAVIGKRRLAVPVAMKGKQDLGVQPRPEAFGVAGAFLLHEGRLIRVYAKQAQDRAPRHGLAAKAAEMAGVKVWIAAPCHSEG